MKLFTRFFLIILSFSLIPVLLTGLWVTKSNTAVRENAQQFHIQVTQLFADVVESFGAELNRSLGFVQELESVAAASHAPSAHKAGDFTSAKRSQEEQRILQRAAATHANISLVSILDSTGKETTRLSDPVKFPIPEFADRSQDPLVQQCRSTGKASWGKVILHQEDPYLPLVYPLPEGKTLYIEYNLASLRRRLQAQSIGKSGRLIILDQDNIPLPGFSPDFPEPAWKGPGELPEGKGWKDDIQTRRGLMVAGFTPCPSLGWRILSLQPRAEALAISPHVAAQAATFILILTVLVTLCAYWISSRMVKPLHALIAGAQRSANNQFDKPVPETGWGELSVLTQSFNVMMRTLRNYQDMQVDQMMEEKAKVESLIHTIPDGIILAAFDGKIVYMNVTARSLLAADSAQITGPKARSIHDTLREPAMRDMILALLQRKKLSESRELEMHSPQGRRLGVFFCRAVTVLHNNREIGIVLTMRDVTAERDLERMKEDFYHGVVHDLRGPLTNIDGFIHIMQTRWGKIPAEQVITYLGYVRRSCERLRQLVSDILDTAKIESGTMKLNIEAVPAEEFVERTKALYVLQTETLGIDIQFLLEKIPSQPLNCDRNLIERVLMNLMGNALKFTPKGGKVSLHVNAAGPHEVEFCVQDSGPGIPADKLEFIFEKFKQLEGEKRSAGYGLGLSICKKIVELHNGRIWAESSKGQGSRFIFRLPLTHS